MGETPRPAGDAAGSSRHEDAIRQSLASADAAARRGGLADAVAWVRMVRSFGHQLSDEWDAKHHEWRTALQRATHRERGR